MCPFSCNLMTCGVFLLRWQSLVSEEDDDEDEEEGKAAPQPEDKFKINKMGIHGVEPRSVRALRHQEVKPQRGRIKPFLLSQT